MNDPDRPTHPAATFLVEHFWPGITPDRFTVAANRVRCIAEASSGPGIGLRFLHATLVPDDESAFTVVEANSPTAVADAYERAGLAHERILHAVQIRIGAAAHPDPTMASDTVARPPAEARLVPLPHWAAPVVLWRRVLLRRPTDGGATDAE
jgi:hypothetical protein